MSVVRPAKKMPRREATATHASDSRPREAHHEPLRVAVGRADLLRMMVTLPPEELPAAAALLGFEERSDDGDNTAEGDGSTTAHSDGTEAGRKAPLGSRPGAAPLAFWRMETMTFSDVEEPKRPQRPARPDNSEGPLTDKDLTSPGRSLMATLRPAPLAPWSRLWPVIREALHACCPGREPDVPALLRSWSRGQWARRIPRVQRRVWAERVSVWVDRSARLVPFWSDQVEVCRRLQSVCGQSGFEIRLLHGRAQAMAMAKRGDFLRGFRPDPETRVLVLGDLGFYASAIERRAWLRTVRRLDLAGVQTSALVPVPPARWDTAMARKWSAVPWEQGRSARVRYRRDPGAWQERAERLLRVVAPAAFVQPGLLRALRLLLPANESDAAAECDVWRHADVRAADAGGLVLQPDASIRWRQRFAENETPAMKKRVSETIRRWHEILPQELLRAETLAWISLVPDEVAPPPGDRDDALLFARRLEVSLHSAVKGHGPAAAHLRRCAGAMLLSMPDSAFELVPELKTAWAATFKDVTVPRVPDLVMSELEQLYKELDAVGAPRWWAVRQVGDQLVFSGSPGSAWPSDNDGPGSPVAWMLAAGQHVWARSGEAGAWAQLALKDGLRVHLPVDDWLSLHTDCCTVTLTCWSPEPWVAASGRDRFGLWAEADVGGVAVRFRWIPPGRFWMGSPENEAGRYEDEGPRHRVTWTDGRWLCDTPVTQALWGEVMGDNPSQFESPERPVEAVSWEDCQQFLAKLNDRVPGLKARLPSEAEWEHACRAGTETATWKGDLEILGKHNAPLLDDIAWYGGNCGVDFELEGGHATTGLSWEEKQHEFEKGGTHPVRQRLPNPLGLFDMLGNVYEWCIDAAEDYSPAPYVGKAVSDPAPNGTGSDRVVRGGSWDEDAGCVRAARRFACGPGDRDASLGFRLARGQAPGPRSGASGGAAERAPNRDAGRGPFPAPPRDAAGPSPFPSPSRRDPKGGRGGR